MITVPVAALALVASLSPLAAVPTVDPVQDLPTEPALFKLVTTSGSGCLAGTVGAEMLPDNSAIVVRYSAYEAFVGVGAKATDARKNCQLAVSITPPAGYTYTIDTIDFSATAYLQNTATATMKINFYSAGMTPPYSTSHTVTGPYQGGWTWSYQVDVSAQTWYPCFEQRYMNINTELRVAGRSSDLTTTTSRARFAPSDDSGASTTYHLRWGRCPQR